MVKVANLIRFGGYNSLEKSVNADIIFQVCNPKKEELMRYFIVIAVLLAATSAFAAVGGGDVTLKNKGGDVIFSHEAHVAGMNLKCVQCHDKPYTNARQHKKVVMKAMQKGKSCGACHDGKKAFSVKGDCAKCHKK